MKYTDIMSRQIQKELDFDLPQDYLDFILKNDGEITNEFNIFDFWPLDKLAQFNLECETPIYLPNILLIGTNGGGTAIGINKFNHELYSTEMIGMDQEYVNKIANNFSEFLELFHTVELI